MKYLIVLWYAVVTVEGGAPHNMAEITPICYRDVSHIPKWDQLGIFIEYTTKYLDLDNDMPILEQQARIWNGGPSGPLKNSTFKYWRKVENEMGKSR